MTIIKYPSKYFQASSSIQLKTYILDLTNTIREIMNMRSQIHTSQSRQEVSNLLLEQTNKLTNLKKIFMCINRIKRVRQQEFSMLKNQINDFNNFNTADKIAYIFGELKATTTLKYDVSSAIRVNFKPKEFLPEMISSTSDEIGFQNIERLMRIYLIKEDVVPYQNQHNRDEYQIFYNITDGILELYDNEFKINATLCGKIEEPIWKIISITHNKKKALPQNILDGILHTVNNKNNSNTLTTAIRFMEYYHINTQSKYLFNLFSKLEFAKVAGNHKSFEVIIYEFNLKIKITNNSKMSVLINSGSVLISKEKKKSISFNTTSTKTILRIIQKTIEDTLGVINGCIKFDIEKGLYIDGTYHTKIPTNIRLEEYIRNIYIEKLEQEIFYKTAISSIKLPFQRNFIDDKFGSKNIIFHSKECFVCFKLEKIKKEEMKIRIFSGVLRKFNIYNFVELELKSINEITYKKEDNENISNSSFNNTTINKEEFSILLKTKLNLLFLSYYIIKRYDCNITISDSFYFSYNGLNIEIFCNEYNYIIKSNLFEFDVHSSITDTISNFILFYQLLTKIERREGFCVIKHKTLSSFGFKYKEFKADICFKEGELLIINENSTIFEFSFSKENTFIKLCNKILHTSTKLLEFIESFYFIYHYGIPVPYASSLCCIIPFNFVFNDSIIIKHLTYNSEMSTSKFLLQKNIFTLKNFAFLKHLNDRYFEINHFETFIDKLQSLIITERLHIMRDYFSKYYKFKDFDSHVILYAGNYTFKIFISNKRLVIQSIGGVDKYSAQERNEVDLFLSTGFNNGIQYLKVLEILGDIEKMYDSIKENKLKGILGN